MIKEIKRHANLTKRTNKKSIDLLVFQVYYERPMVTDSLNLKLRQIARISSNVILDEMLSAKCHLFGFFFLITQHEDDFTMYIW